MSNFLENILGLFHPQKDEDVDLYKYNYQYIAPLAMIDKVPFPGFTLKWAAKVGWILLQTLINQMAIRVNDDLQNCLDDMDNAKDEIEEDNILTALRIMFKVVIELRLHDTEGHLKDLELTFHGMPSSLNPDKAGREYLIQLGGNIFSALKDTAPSGHLNSLDEYKAMFRTLPLPAIAATFDQNSTFADMRVAGPNPMMLSRVRDLDLFLQKMPITGDQYQEVMGAADSLEKAFNENRLYETDYAMLNGALLGTYPMDLKFMAAPIALFAVPADGADRKLRVVAIQCEQTPGPKNPVWTTPPSDADESRKVAWEMAKTFVSIADGNVHEAIFHLGRTHMVVEPFVVATMNELAEDHPVSRLLTPHFEGTLFINNAAQSTLLKSGGVIDKIMGGTIGMSCVVAALGAQGVLFNFDQSYLHQNLADRGVDDPNALPYFPYRDCAQKVWSAIHQWVAEYLAIYYPEELDPEKDTKLQEWYQELTSFEGGRLRSFGETGMIRTRTYLTEALTMVIYTASAQHAAVNFPQRNIMSYTPAMPLAGYQPCPDPDQTYTYQDWMNQLPPCDMTMQQLNTGTLLGGVYYTTLGKYDKNWFPKDVDPALEKFQARLAELDALFGAEYGDQYPYLRPSKIPQSINI